MWWVCTQVFTHQAGLCALTEALQKRSVKKIPTENLIKIAEFVLKNNFFEFNSKVFRQISGTAIGAKFSPPYACFYIDRVEQGFLETQDFYNHCCSLGKLTIFFSFGLRKN